MDITVVSPYANFKSLVKYKYVVNSTHIIEILFLVTMTTLRGHERIILNHSLPDVIYYANWLVIENKSTTTKSISVQTPVFHQFIAFSKNNFENDYLAIG